MSVTDLVNEMSDQELSKKIVTNAIEAFAENIYECFKEFPVPAGITKRDAADTYIRTLAMIVANFGEERNITTKEYLTGIAMSCFLVEHIDEIVAKVIEKEEDNQTTVTE